MTGCGRSTERGVLACGCALLAVAALGSGTPSAGEPPAIAAWSAEVDAATRPSKPLASAAARAEAIHRLVDLHDRLVADPRFATSHELRILRGRVAARLAQHHARLRRDLPAAPCPSATPSAGGAAADPRQLVDLIQATVRPESWEANGGTGTIRYFDNGHGLVVSAPEDVHEELDNLLRQLRR